MIDLWHHMAEETPLKMSRPFFLVAVSCEIAFLKYFQKKICHEMTLQYTKHCTFYAK